jgi:hypothetical protein
MSQFPAMAHDTLISRIKAHCDANRISESTFGLRVVNDGKLVSRLIGGGSVTLATLERIDAALVAPVDAKTRDNTGAAA